MKEPNMPETEAERNLEEQMLEAIENVDYILDDISDMLDMRISLTRQAVLEMKRLNHLVNENDGASKTVEQRLRLLTERIETLSRK